MNREEYERAIIGFTLAIRRSEDSLQRYHIQAAMESEKLAEYKRELTAAIDGLAKLEGQELPPTKSDSPWP